MLLAEYRNGRRRRNLCTTAQRRTLSVAARALFWTHDRAAIGQSEDTDFDDSSGSNADAAAGGLVEDAVLVLLMAFLAPIAIIVVGTPIALCVRLVVEIARRW